MKPIFVTGTGTGTGKTLASAALLRALGDALNLHYVKPVQTGYPPDDDAAAVAELSGRPERVSRDGHRMKDPVSPHLAAEREGVDLDVAGLAGVVRDAVPASRRALVEGAGGLLVPVNGRETLADLVAALDAEVVVAALGGLGTINHTLLTLSELERRGAPARAVLLYGDVLADNADVIESRGGVPVAARIPRVAAPDGPGVSAERAVAQAAASLSPSLFPASVETRP